MGPKSKRARFEADADDNNLISEATDPSKRHYSRPPLAAITDQDRATWQGFSDIDSDPVLFTSILEEWGVKGIQVREVFSLEEDGLAFVPRPIYGLVFLFRYKADDVTKQEATCPDHVWFANQLYDKACASVALLNIINNIADAQLGENIQAFKEFSQDLTPVQRGQTIGSFEFIKRIHNSFARKMDMLNVDLCLENQYDDRRKPKGRTAASASKTGGKKGKPKGKITADDFSREDDEAALHFIAFVPVHNEVWKLDGLDRQPQKVGTVEEEDWLSLVVPDLSARMAQYEEDQIEFSILAVVQDPLSGLGHQLADNQQAVAALERRLHMLGDGDGATAGVKDADGDHHITDAADDAEAQLPGPVRQKLSVGSEQELAEYRRELLLEERSIRASIRDEEHSQACDREKALQRRFDPTPFLHQWLTFLAQKDGVMKELVDEARL